jgi:hypothetical protein
MSPLIISPLIAFLPLLFCLAFHFTDAIPTDFIKYNYTFLPGHSLSTSESDWIRSRQGIYYLGFFPRDKNSAKQYLVICRWYNLYIDIVWVANREHPFPNSSAVLTFNQDGNLVISDGSSLYVVTNTSGGNDTYANLLDTGKLLAEGGRVERGHLPSLNPQKLPLLPSRIFLISQLPTLNHSFGASTFPTRAREEDASLF